MKNLLLILICSFLSLNIQAQESSNYPSSRYASVDSIIHYLYQSISGDKGVKRDWVFFKSLFREDAKLIPSQMGGDGIMTARYLTTDDYITLSGEYLENQGFFEVEINRVSESYGNICHIFSTYESYRTSQDEKPFARGINSIQLLFDNYRWWIVNIYWQGESRAHPLPEQYLPSEK